MLFFMQASKKIPFDDPFVLNIVRAAYVISNVLIVGVYLYVQSKINAKKGALCHLLSYHRRSQLPLLLGFFSITPRTCPPPFSTAPAQVLHPVISSTNTPPNTDKTTLKYVEPAAPGSQDGPKLVTTTIQQYDLSQLRKLWQGQLMGVGMMAVMHLYMKYTNPLLIQVCATHILCSCLLYHQHTVSPIRPRPLGRW